MDQLHALSIQDQSPLAARNVTLRIRVRDAAGAIVFEGESSYFVHFQY